VDLAGRFAVSRVPLREALKTLEAQGIVARARNRGLHIVALDDVRIDRVCELRAALETIAARSAVAAYRADPARLKAIEAAIATIEAAVKRRDWPAVNKADLAFHHEICLASKNDILITLWQGLARHVWMIFGREILNRNGRMQIVQQHRDLIAALLAASDDGIAALIKDHVMRLRRPLR
jgi:DNA-binding GntR family transcriptional regulator